MAKAPTISSAFACASAMLPSAQARCRSCGMLRAVAHKLRRCRPSSPALRHMPRSASAASRVRQEYRRRAARGSREIPCLCLRSANTLEQNGMLPVFRDTESGDQGTQAISPSLALRFGNGLERSPARFPRVRNATDGGQSSGGITPPSPGFGQCCGAPWCASRRPRYREAVASASRIFPRRLLAL